ncbi:LysR family transcriptional regulator [Hoeflea sp. TYP-13]|uniref:LysR family transcriptional regulator n=1 Tax=Hoeflea sp. TYP-13 TaxID=3230023 RepID=UPI0034C5C843
MEEFYPRRLLPSTSMLIAFDSAARTGSFTAAAEELNLTQGAISRQVQALENQLDVKLFRRANKKITLTDAGRAYAREINVALKRIQTASLFIKTNPRAGLLNIAILPTFGTRWLMPRFPSFLERNPEITVNFVTKLSQFDFGEEGLHAAIHFGLPDWPNTVSTFLMREESVPVASPQFLEQREIKQPEDLAQAPLLHLTSRSQAWADWLEANGVSAFERQGLLFEQFSTAAQAAAAGLGVALLPKFLINKEIGQGELSVIFDKSVPTSSAYYLMVPNESTDYAPAVAFKDWLQEMAGEQSHQ